jgi:hypothetical protein
MARSADDWGRVVGDALNRWGRRQPDPRPAWLVPWDDLTEQDKDADRTVGCAVAARAQREAHDALVPVILDLTKALSAICDSWEQTGDVGVHLFAAGRDAVTRAERGAKG